jgi:hypothetical protein
MTTITIDPEHVTDWGPREPTDRIELTPEMRANLDLAEDDVVRFAVEVTS